LQAKNARLVVLDLLRLQKANGESSCILYNQTFDEFFLD